MVDWCAGIWVSKTMKTNAVLVVMLVLSISACAQKTSEPHISAKLDTTVPWLQVKIWEYQNQSVTYPPRKVIKTTFEGKVVFYVPERCCDIPSELYAEDGALICYPGGGFAVDLKCPMFKIEYLDNIKNKKTSIVWEDKRKPAVGSSVVQDFAFERVKNRHHLVNFGLADALSLQCCDKVVNRCN
jgi:hypothetical protein